LETPFWSKLTDGGKGEFCLAGADIGATERIMRNSRLLLTIAAFFTVSALACGPSQEELDAQRARADELTTQLDTAHTERDALQRQIDEMTARNDAIAAQLATLGTDVETLRGHNATLQTDREALASTLAETQRALEELRERQRQAEARLATFRALLTRFRSMIESNQLRIRIDRNRMIVELPAGVLFESGRSDLKAEGQATVAQVAAVLRQIPDREFQIAGHTDNVGMRGGDNWQLSSMRAVTVLRFLVSNQVPANRLSASGYADTQPVATNDTEDGRRQNRRIDIVLLPNLNELPDLSSLDSSSPATP
jgi:chemotaxis protein MotB